MSSLAGIQIGRSSSVLSSISQPQHIVPHGGEVVTAPSLLREGCGSPLKHIAETIFVVCKYFYFIHSHLMFRIVYMYTCMSATSEWVELGLLCSKSRAFNDRSISILL